MSASRARRRATMSAVTPASHSGISHGLLTLGILVGLCACWTLMAELIQGLQTGWSKPWFIVFVIHGTYAAMLLPYAALRHARMRGASTPAAPPADAHESPLLSAPAAAKSDAAAADASPRQLVAAGVALSVLASFVAMTWYVSLTATLVSVNNALYQSSAACVFLFSVLLRLDAFSWSKLVAVGVCFAGAALAYLLSADGGGGGGPVTQTPAGYAWAMASTVSYALYEVLYAHWTQRRHASARDAVCGRTAAAGAPRSAPRAPPSPPLPPHPALPLPLPAPTALRKAENAALVLGAIGVASLLLQWPLFFVFDAAGVEPYELPSPAKARLLALNAGLDTLYNFLLLLGIAVTSPLTMALGSMLVVPASLLADWALHGVVPTPGAGAGIGLICLGFALLQAPPGALERVVATYSRRVVAAPPRDDV